MHPEVIESSPGDCPICAMPLVRIKEAPATDAEPTSTDQTEEGVIRIDPVQVQNIGVVSTEVRVEDIARVSRTVGILDFNADHITWINTKFEGWIEKVHVNYVGQDVQRGRPLFEIYSPELVTTQEEYLRALEYRDSLVKSGRPETLRQAEDLVRSSRDRLAYWDISDEQIESLEQSGRVQRRLTVMSPAHGVVAEIMSEALEGMFVKPGMNLYKIADLSTVWVHADVYESDMPWIRDGQPAVVTFRNDPEREFRGKVLFLYPEVSRDTRTLKICVQVPNPDRRLRPGMYADVVVQGPPVRDAVVAPQSAVIRSGERDIIFVDLGEGRFQAREVEVGIQGESDRVQILEGIAPGEAVVTQAQFMLDSESRIQEAIAKFRQRGSARSADPSREEPPAAGHEH
jgi:Cu(I)/Ag(I) efflux system membrane fusion protein/cobalt-zinc-cadmium efflux system membrane fusion protein